MNLIKSRLCFVGKYGFWLFFVCTDWSFEFEFADIYDWDNSGSCVLLIFRIIQRMLCPWSRELARYLLGWGVHKVISRQK